MSKQSHYPSFDVMKEQDEWDDHTQSIVTSRLESKHKFQFLAPFEVKMLESIGSILVNDRRSDVMQFVLDHIDQSLHQSFGEGERKAGVPEAKTLIREGLKGIELSAQSLYSTAFIDLELNNQKQLLQQLSESRVEPASAWTQAPQQPLFEKILRMTIESYCSHPTIWSEIGYAGPAYPRGYVRTQQGQLDPWEAQPE